MKFLLKKVRRYLSPLEVEITKNKEKMKLEKKFKLMNNGNLKNTEVYDFYISVIQMKCFMTNCTNNASYE